MEGAVLTQETNSASSHNRDPFVQIEVPHPYPKEGEPPTISQMLWPDHCVSCSQPLYNDLLLNRTQVQGTPGCEIESSVAEALKPWVDSKKGQIVQKVPCLASLVSPPLTTRM